VWRDAQCVRHLPDELPHRQSPQKGRLHPTIGNEQCRGLVGVPRFERLEIFVHGALHTVLSYPAGQGGGRIAPAGA